MYDAITIAKACSVSVATVYKIRKDLNLDRLPTVDEIRSRNKHVGRPFKQCPNNETSQIDKN